MLLLLIWFILLALLALVKADITISDPLDSCKGFTITNSDSPNQFAYAVDGGGDFNGDGIPDMAISTYETDPTPSTVYVIYGQPNGYSDIDVATMTPSQGFKITGLRIVCFDNPNFISIAGDVDGDNITDLVIGASSQDGVGAGFVIYGKEGGYDDFDATSTLPSTVAKISGVGGWNANSRTDINGDGIADIVITSSGADSTFGAVYVIYGSQTRLTSFNIATTPLAPPVGFKISGYNLAFIGAAFGSAGDFNGDGYGDFTFSAPGALSDAGVGYVIYGQENHFSGFSVTDSSAPGRFTVTGAGPIPFKLCLVASDAGDFNNDTYTDILWGSPPTNGNQGSVMLIYGANGGPTDFGISSMNQSQGLTLTGALVGDYLGSSLASLKDVNGDGISEILVGSKGFSGGQGIVYLIYGRQDQPSTMDIASFTEDQGTRIMGSTSGALFGASVRSLGDINGDGVPDIIIGAPGTTTTGKAYVLFGGNAWACDTCNATAPICQTCQAGYNYTWNGVCFKECPVYAPFELNKTCFSQDPTIPPTDPNNSTNSTNSTSPTNTTNTTIPTPPSQPTPPTAPTSVGSDLPPYPPRNVMPSTLKGGVAKSGETTSTTNKVANFWSPADAMPFIYGQFKTSINYMRYLNISRSEKLEEMFLLYAQSDTNIIPWISMPSSIKNSFPNHTLPGMFPRYGLPSSFIANFGDDFTCLIIILVAFIAIQLAYSVIRRWIRNLPTVKLILHKGSTTLQNFFIGSFAESFGPIVFYATLEFKNSSSSKHFATLSPFTCCVCLAFGISLMILNLWMVRKLQFVRRKILPSHHKENHEYKLLEKKYEGLSVLYEEFDNESALQQSAFLFFNLRAIIESIIVGVLFGNPLAQSVILMVVNLLFLLYLLLKRPFESKLALLQQFILLLLIFIINCCFLRLAISDHGTSTEGRASIITNVSNVVFVVLMVFQFVPLAFFGLNVLAGIWKLLKFLYVQFFSNKKKSPLQKSSKHKNSSILPLDQNSLDASILHTLATNTNSSLEITQTNSPYHFPIQSQIQQALRPEANSPNKKSRGNSLKKRGERRSKKPKNNEMSREESPLRALNKQVNSPGDNFAFDGRGRFNESPKIKPFKQNRGEPIQRIIHRKTKPQNK